MRTHTIRLIPASPGRYDAEHNGATIVTDFAAPVQAAAAALIAAGASLSDELKILCPDVSIATVTLAAILRPRQPLPKFRDFANDLPLSSDRRRRQITAAPAASTPRN